MQWLHGALLAVALLAIAVPVHAESEVRGRVVLDLPGMRITDLGPIVVYVAPIPGVATPTPTSMPAVHQKNAAFAPGFLAIAAGQNVAMLNDDEIYHNVFSYSKPNDFDLGLYAAGLSRQVTFMHPGQVKLYCSIHESMNGVIFVSPTPWFAVADTSGRFVLRGVPPGARVLRTWNEKLPETQHRIDVPATGTASIEVSLLPTRQ
jgi:plastocyanin